MQAFWWTLLTASALALIVLVAFACPRFFLKLNYFLKNTDRGLKRYKIKNGEAVVYTPFAAYQKFISQYIILDKNGHKTLLCKLALSMQSIDYELVLFDSLNKAFDILSFSQTITKQGLTDTVALPPKTAHLTLIVKAVDGIDLNDARSINKVNKKSAKSILNKRLALFALISFLLIIIEMFFIKLCLTQIFGGVFSGDFYSSPVGIFYTLCISVFLAAAALLAQIVYIKFLTRPCKKEGNIND